MPTVRFLVTTVEGETSIFSEETMAAIGSLPSSVILTMLMETDPVVTLADRAKAVRRAGDCTLDDGVKAHVVRIDVAMQFADTPQPLSGHGARLIHEASTCAPVTRSATK